jgi:hypothetical protein
MVTSYRRRTCGGGVDNTPNIKTAENTATPSAPPRAELSEVQKQQLTKQLNPKITNSQIKTMMAEASPTVEKVLAMTACFYPGNSFGAYQSSGGNLFSFSSNPWLLKHHDSTRCVNVQRIKDWKASAKNALTFNVMYVSDESGESFEQKYEIQKQLDDVWLFNN